MSGEVYYAVLTATVWLDLERHACCHIAAVLFYWETASLLEGVLSCTRAMSLGCPWIPKGHSLCSYKELQDRLPITKE